MAEKTLTLDAQGIWTYPNQYSKVPIGAYTEANNVVIDAPGIVEARRGWFAYGDSLGPEYVDSIYNYQNRVLIHQADGTMLYDSDGTGTWVAYSGTFNVPDALDNSSRIRASTMNKNIYFTTANGIFKLDLLTGDIILAGVPAGLGGTGATTGASGFMANNVNVAYRVVWGYTDNNDNLILGAPSDRIVVSNTSGGTRNVNLTFQIPTGITTSHFFQVYRSSQSATINDEPNDELQQVYEANPSAGEIIAGSITITDIVPDDLRQASLYTNVSQEGIEQANYRPPFAKDVAAFRNHMFYANTRTPHRFYMTLYSVAGTTGIDIGDTIDFTRDGGSPTFTLTGAATEDASAGEFEVFTGGTAAENIADTALSIVRVINQYASNTFLDAYYVSGFDELPGQILLEETSLTQSFFYVNCSTQTAFTPQLPGSGVGTSNFSTNETKPNRVYFSKFQEPEAVPLLNFLDIGDADQPIQRILPLRDSLYVLKSDGVYRIIGTAIPFSYSLLDTSTRIVGPNTAVVLNNQVVFFCEQGVAAASDSAGVGIISNQIKGDLLELSSDLFPNFPAYSFGIAYESDNRYILATIQSADDTRATHQYVYSGNTQTWTRWTGEFTCGFVNPTDNKLYFGRESLTDTYVYTERKDYALSDFADEEFDVTIVSSSGTVVTLASTANVVEGMTLRQGGETAIIEQVVNATTIVVDRVTVWNAGAAQVFTPIRIRVTTVPQDADMPVIMKHFRDFSMIFSDSSFEELTVRFRSDLSVLVSDVTISPVRQGAWGQFQWGQVPWGGFIQQQQRIRTLVPRGAARCNWLQISFEIAEAFTTFSLNGISLMFMYHAGGERMK